MSPLRTILINLSRIPPAVMLIAIMGIAITVTLAVTNHMAANDKDTKDRTEALIKQMDQRGKVVVAIKDVPEGELIASANLEEQQLPLGKIPEDAITSASLVAGRVSKYGITAGQIVSQRDLASQTAVTSFENKLKEGTRAITFAVDNNSGVAGFISPDSHIDILSMVGSGAETKAAPILSDVRVVAVGQLYQKNPGGAATPASSLTVSVTPVEAQKLVKAISASKIYVSLRNGSDHTPVATVDVTQMFKRDTKNLISSIGDLPPLAPLAPPPVLPGVQPDMQDMGIPQASSSFHPAIHEVEIWTGSKKDLLSVPKG